MKDMPKYTLDELLAGMEEGDMPCDKAWDLCPLWGASAAMKQAIY